MASPSAHLARVKGEMMPGRAASALLCVVLMATWREWGRKVPRRDLKRALLMPGREDIKR